MLNHSSKNSLPLMEAFYTIQGEGAWQGTPACFIRLQGCDVGCTWCDVKESWEVGKFPSKPVGEIVARALNYPSRIAVVTGGEPLMHDLDLLTENLHNQGFRTHLETSGAYPLSGSWDWICLSPKKFRNALPEFYQAADELKIIVFNTSDFRWAEEHAGRVNDNCRLFLQPEWSRMEKHMEKIVDYVKANPRWKISLQVHKFMNIP
jgi:organic radical activating enzyme